MTKTKWIGCAMIAAGIALPFVTFHCGKWWLARGQSGVPHSPDAMRFAYFAMQMSFVMTLALVIAGIILLIFSRRPTE